MNTKGVEDGISDDQEVKRSLSDICEELCPGVKARNANAFKRDPEVCLHGLKNCDSPLCSKLPKPAEDGIEAKQESPEELPPLRAALLAIMPHLNELPAETYHRLAPIAHAALSPSAAVPVEERTAVPTQAQPWICFHCEFRTTNKAEAAAHFGDRDDPEECKPLCKWWDRMSEDERIGQMQDLIQQLNDERADIEKPGWVTNVEYKTGRTLVPTPDGWRLLDAAASVLEERTRTMDKCDRAQILVARFKNCGYLTDAGIKFAAPHIRIALDKEVEAGGPFTVPPVPEERTAEMEQAYRHGFNDCRDKACRIVDEHDGFLNRISSLEAIHDA